MDTKEFGWKNAHGHKIYAVEWSVEHPRAVVGIIHGLGEHCRRYDHLAAFFGAHGVAAVGYDRQGFGRSGGKKGYARHYREYLDEIAHLVVECEHRYPDLPVFLYGHSMGGQLLLHYLIRRRPDLSGAIVSAPHVRTAFPEPKILIAAGKLIRKVAPGFTQDNQLDADQLSRDPEVVSNYLGDPLVHQRLSVQTGIELLERATFLDAYAKGLPVPTLLMHGTADGITSQEASRAFADRNPNALTYKAWEGFYHELHNEPQQGEVFTYVLAWIERHLNFTHRPPVSV